MKVHFLLFSIISFCLILLGAFGFLIYGPQTLTPPPNWPFTEDSRRQYDPFGSHSKRVVAVYVDDYQNGRLKY